MNEQQEKINWKNNKSGYIAAGIIVALVIVLGVYLYIHNGNKSGSGQASTQSNLSSASAATSTPTSTPANTGGLAKLSYGAAIKAYPERFQFLLCQGTPATIAVRKGTPVMLDNRNATGYTFKADTQTFNIGGYSYDVFYPEVLGNIVVTCNGKPSVTLNVEK